MDNAARPAIVLLACACLLGTWAAPATAGTAQALFAVQINLNNPLASGGTVNPPSATSSSGYCISQSLSLATNATVTVTCATNQFVSISPGSSFLGHGGAYRFLLDPTALVTSDDTLGYMGTGTVTTMHVFHEEGQADTMEMLVSF